MSGGAGAAPELVLRAGEAAGATRPLPGLPGEGALLVIDVQRSFAAPAELAANGLTTEAIRRVADSIDAAGRAVDAARAAGMAVVWVELQQRADAPWVASHWLRQRAVGEPGPCMAGTEGAEWYGLQPGPGEPRVAKRRYSGFIGTDLDAVLRSLGVTWVAACGLTTECCVESTARDAFQLDYPVVIPEDACAAYRAEDHHRALELLALNFALVTDVRSLEVALARAAAPVAPGLATAR